MPLAPHAVVFDMDGVIIDSEPSHNRASQNALRRFGIEMDLSDFHQFTGKGAEMYHKSLVDDYGLEASMQDLIAANDEEIAKVFEEGYEEVEGTRELLEELKKRGVRIALASSSSREMIDDVLSRLDLDRMFDAVVSGREVKRGKPAPDVYMAAAKALGVPPEDCVAIEDAQAGVAAAKAAGMKAVGYANPNSTHQDLSAADVVVKKMEEVISYLF